MAAQIGSACLYLWWSIHMQLRTYGSSYDVQRRFSILNSCLIRSTKKVHFPLIELSVAGGMVTYLFFFDETIVECQCLMSRVRFKSPAFFLWMNKIDGNGHRSRYFWTEIRNLWSDFFQWTVICAFTSIRNRILRILRANVNWFYQKNVPPERWMAFGF